MTDDAVIREADFEVPAEELWEFVADEDERRSWLGDAAPAEVDEVEPGRRLSFEWHDEGLEPSTVTFVVVPTPDGSRLVVTETRPVAGLQQLQARRGHRRATPRALLVAA